MTTPTTTTTSVLITGATQGLGAETAARLAERGWTVWLGARDAAAGEAVAQGIRAAQAGADVRVAQLDVTDDGSVAAAYDVVASGGLDVLVNNAGVSGGRLAPAEETADQLLEVYAVNVAGPVRVSHAFLPLLRRSERPRLVMVSSSMGSLGTMTAREPAPATAWGLAYPSSKAALNMISVLYARSLPDVRVTAVTPGYTATGLNGFTGGQTVAEGAEAIVEACVAEELPAGLLGREGVLPW